MVVGGVCVGGVVGFGGETQLVANFVVVLALTLDWTALMMLALFWTGRWQMTQCLLECVTISVRGSLSERFERGVQKTNKR